VAGYRKSTTFFHIRKSPMGVICKGNVKGIIFPNSMKMPFWGFINLTKKMQRFFLSQNVWI